MRDALISFYLHPERLPRIFVAGGLGGLLTSVLTTRQFTIVNVLAGLAGGLIATAMMFVSGWLIFARRVHSDPIRQRYLDDMYAVVEEILAASEKLPPQSLDTGQRDRVMEVLLRTAMLSDLMKNAMATDGFGPNPEIDAIDGFRFANALLLRAREHLAELTALAGKVNA